MNLKRAIDKMVYSYKNIGFIATNRKIIDKLFNKKEEADKINYDRYVGWQLKNNLTNEEIEAARNISFDYSPKISIVIPLYNTKKEYFEELINYIRMQTYLNWELCLADGSENKNPFFEEHSKIDERIKYEFLGENLGIAGNTNEAIKMASGDYIFFMDHDDLIQVTTLTEIVKVLNNDKTIDFIYSDEDKMYDDKIRFDPHFKPDFSLETLECTNYITHIVVASKELVNKTGFLRSEFDGAQDFDYVLRLTKNAKNIYHIPNILYHWRIAEGSTAKDIELKPYALDAGKNALNRYFKEYYNGDIEALDSVEVPGVYKIKFKVKNNPKVNIIIPNKDNIRVLDRAIKSIEKLTTYKNYKIYIVENNSTDEATFEYYKTIKEKYDNIEILYYPEKVFNYSKIINYGVKNSSLDGEFILQLNNDVKLLTPDWLEQMIGLMQKEGVGAVGARLYYEDMTIQHAGIAYGIDGTAGNLFVNLPKGRHAYLGMEAMMRNVSAVTGACLMTSRKMYEDVGFMNEDLAVAFNDVDFCLKIREKGYRVVYNPWVELIHYESKSRGYEDTEEKKQRFEKEKEIFKSNWKNLLEEDKDPYFNINFSREFAEFIIKDEKIKWKM